MTDHHRYVEVIGKEKTRFVEMDQSQPCACNKISYYDSTTEKWLTKAVTIQASPPRINPFNPPAV